MAITHAGAAGQGNASAVSGTTIALTRSATAVNNLLVVGASYNVGSGTPTIADTQGGTWVPIDATFNDATNVSSIRGWYCFANNTSSRVITVTTPTAGFRSIVLDEFTGTDLTSPLDKFFHSVAGASGTPISPSFTPAFNDELLWGYVSDSATSTPMGPFDGTAATLAGDDLNQDLGGYLVLTGRSGIAMTIAFTGSGAYDLIGATFTPPQTAPISLNRPAFLRKRVPLQQRVFD